MRSYLTQKVFRRLITNQPLRFRCPQNFYAYRPHNEFLSWKRTLFGISFKQPREPREAQLAPGLKLMNDLIQAENTQTRPPPIQDVVKAWKKFFKYKTQRKETVNTFEASYMLRAFRHIQNAIANGLLPESEGPTVDDKFVALQRLTKVPSEKHNKHNELAKELYNTCNKEFVGKLIVKARHALLCYIRIIAASGEPAHARDCVETYFLGSEPLVEIDGTHQLHFWRAVMTGFADEGNEVELLKIADTLDSLGLSNKVGSILLRFYAGKGDSAGVRKYYEELKTGNTPLSAKTLFAILDYSTSCNDMEWCKSVFKDVLNSTPSKAQWDIILQWAAGSMGKGVEEVERMMAVMERDPNIRADISTINGLVTLGMRRNDSYLAERFVTLGIKHGICPDATTYALQIEYRIMAGDFTGAQSAYKALQSEEVAADEDLPAVNKYIRALCNVKVPDFDLISDIITDLDERKASFEADTVSDLSSLYLARDEADLTLDLLKTQAFHYSIDERINICDNLLKYVFDPEIDIMKAWEAYNIIVVQVFSETCLEKRTEIMQHFFKRRRSDMALHVFGHMRSDVRPTYRPVISTYIECFEGLGICADRESLDIVYNMFKMDSSVEPNTAVHNALIYAYTECEHSDKAVRFWDDITNSVEGPSYRSLELVFRACQRKPFGDQKAKSIWAQIRRMEIEITREVFVAYVGALAGQGRLEDAKALVESGEKDLGLKPDWQTIGHFYNAIGGQNRKDFVEKWAKELYPDVWTELAAFGQKKMKEGHRLFQLPGVELRDHPDEEEEYDD
ncbi:hypothetical protein BJ878DRAFT_504756 [Calycina marina]|uniref:Uncharacterized protein n=1 Tax=Calycina marina TaxID=1763456 RepID=A0A9P7Z366_9HELO|nr:hypothetical protein BJ878DRAFT_504756 [Calycina marina]